MTYKVRRGIETLIWRFRQLQLGRRMATGRLWQAIFHPRRSHPVITWTQRADSRFQITRTRLILMAGIMLLPLALYGSVLSGMSVPVVVIGLLALIPALALIGNGTVLGTYWAMLISQTIAREYQGKRFELLTVTPHGTFEISWLIALGTLHRSTRLKQAFHTVSGVVKIIMLALTFGLLMILIDFIGLNEFERFAHFSLLLQMIATMAIVMGLWFDHIQSIIVSVLVGVLIPAFVTSPQLARNLAIGVFLTIQVIFYAAIVAFYLAAQDGLLRWVVSYWLSQFLVVVLTFCLFFLLRDGLIRFLKWFTLKRYHATHAEFQMLVS